MVVVTCCLLMLSAADSSRQAPASPSPTVDSQPALIDVNDVRVVVEARRYPTVDPNSSKFSSQLEGVVQAKLEKAKFHVVGQTDDAAMRQTVARKLNVDPNSLRWRPSDVPILHIAVNVLFLDTGSLAALYVRTSVTRPVRLVDGGNGQLLKATIWSGEPAMASMPAAQWEDEASKVVLQQVDAFIAAPRAAPAGSGGNQAAPANSFVASKTGSEFHRPECPVARTISPENLATYKTREEALAAGKRPCRSCNP
jgi:hypothetical protein